MSPMVDDLYGSPEHQLFRADRAQVRAGGAACRARASSTQMGRFDKTLYQKMGELGMLGLRYDPQVGRRRARLVATRRSCSRRSAAATTPAWRWGSASTPTWRRRRCTSSARDELKQQLPRARDQGRDGVGDRRHRARRRLRRRGDQDARRARRRRLGDQRQQDLHHQRRHRRLALPARGDRSRRPATAASRRSSCRPTRRASATSCSTRSATGAPTPACSSSRTCACRSPTRSARSAAASSSR